MYIAYTTRWTNYQRDIQFILCYGETNPHCTELTGISLEVVNSHKSAYIVATFSTKLIARIIAKRYIDYLVKRYTYTVETLIKIHRDTGIYRTRRMTRHV